MGTRINTTFKGTHYESLGKTFYLQGTASTSVGAYNKIIADDETKRADGIANTITGSANIIEHSNGAVIIGSGNTIKNGYKDADFGGMLTWLNMSSGDISSLKNYELGSVGIIGGANTAENALFSNVQGVKNTLTGTAEKPSAFNSIDGYSNRVNNARHTFLAGSYNTVENANQNIVMGNHTKLTGDDADKGKNNIVLGFNDSENALINLGAVVD